jgi:phenylalanyl-tRNA synthetase alpha chain
MKEKIEQLKKQALEEIEKLKSNEDFQEIQKKYFSNKSGEFAALTKEIKHVAEDIKPLIGKLMTTSRKEVEQKLGAKLEELGLSMQEHAHTSGWIDTTISVDQYKLGHLHPMTQVMRDLEEAFRSMGFMVLDGPEIESDFYNFEGLNIPTWHPARDMQDTFYIDSDLETPPVLRTHTSGIQIRAMQEYGAPLRMVAPGRVYRNEATDVTHDHTFYQLECLMVDENISIANLTATLKELVSAIFKEDIDIRLRPGYFPFVEPGFELDMWSPYLNKWVEMGGSGMVHPNVLRAGGIDPEKYSGFAFGMGVTRLLMLKYGITDIRLLQSGDLRFLNQF